MCVPNFTAICSVVVEIFQPGPKRTPDWPTEHQHWQHYAVKSLLISFVLSDLRCFVDSGCCWGVELKFLIKGFFFPFSFWEVLSLAQLNWLPVELLPIKYKRINPKQNANLFRVQSGSFFSNNEQMCVTRELCNLYKAEVKKKGGDIRHSNMLMLCFYVPFRRVFMWMHFVWILLCVY